MCFRCLYRPACRQKHNNEALLLYQTTPMNDSTDATFMATQCAKGHEGSLCGKCSNGYGQRMTALIGRCQACGSPASIIILYLLATFASLAFIRLLCFFNSIQQGGSASTRPTASQALPQPLAAAGPLTSSGSCNTKQRPGDLRGAGSDAAMARGMSDHKDQPPSKGAAVGPSPFVETAESSPCKACGRTEASSPGSTANKDAKQDTRDRAPVGDLLKPFTIYLQASDAPGLCSKNTEPRTTQVVQQHGPDMLT